jgi:hypothetical protein
MAASERNRIMWEGRLMPSDAPAAPTRGVVCGYADRRPVRELQSSRGTCPALFS